MQEYCGCDTTPLREVLHLPNELAGDGESSGMSISNRGCWFGTLGYTLKHVCWGDGT